MKLMNVTFLFSCSLILTQIHGMEPTERQIPSLKELCINFSIKHLQNNNNSLQNIELTTDAQDQLLRRIAHDFMAQNPQLRHFVLSMLLVCLYAEESTQIDVEESHIFATGDLSHGDPIDHQISVTTQKMPVEDIMNLVRCSISLNENAQAIILVKSGFINSAFNIKTWDIDTNTIMDNAGETGGTAPEGWTIDPLFFEINDMLKNKLTYDQTQLLDVIYQANQANGLPVLNTINQVTLNQAGQAVFETLPDILYCLLEPYVIQNQQ